MQPIFMKLKQFGGDEKAESHQPERLIVGIALLSGLHSEEMVRVRVIHRDGKVEGSAVFGDAQSNRGFSLGKSGLDKVLKKDYQAIFVGRDILIPMGGEIEL